MSYLPTRDEILQKAIELFFQEMQRTGRAGLPGLPYIMPEEEELKEGSYWIRARDELMRERTEAAREEMSYLEQMAAELGYKIVPEKLAERVDELKDTLEKLRSEQKRRREAERALEEATAKRAEAPEIQDLRRKLTEAELTVKDLEAKLEAYPTPPLPFITPPPTPRVPLEALPPAVRPAVEERVISRECWSLYKRFWNAINNQRAIDSASEVMSVRTGVGASLIAEAVAFARMDNSRKVEDLIDKLLKCECLREK